MKPQHNLATLADTEALGASLAAMLRPGDVLLLQGDLGAGKTTLARAILQALVPGLDEVPSPTFTLLQSYDTPGGLLHHYDLYRLKHPDEIFELGFDESLAEGMVLVEWPERLGVHVPKRAKWVRLALGTDGNRTAQLEGF